MLLVNVLSVMIPLLLLFPALPQGQQPSDEASESQFQFKNIVLGVSIEPDSVRLLDAPRVRAEFLEMVNTTISNLNNNTYPNTNGLGSVFGGQGSSGNYYASTNSSLATNGTRTSTVTVVTLHHGVDTDLDVFPEISILLTILDCADTHALNQRVINHYGPIVHIAFTEPGCKRLRSADAITIPLTWVIPNADLLQVLVDIRSERVLPGWKEAVIINDKESGDEIIDVFGEGFKSTLLYPDITQTIYNVDSMSFRVAFSEQIEAILGGYTKSSPGNYIVITKSGNVNRVLEAARRTGFLSILKQWLFISPNPMEEEFNWEYTESNIIDDGVNIAFVMNSTAKATNTSNQLFCNSQALLVLLSDTIESLAQWEFDLYLQVSNEEWDIIKPSRADRVSNITGAMTFDLSSKVLGVCDKNSSTWNLFAGENGQVGKQVFEVGWWNPVTGLRMTDDLLPHVTGGFRGRRINVASMHFPPWQIISRDDPSNPDNVTYSGLMFEVLNHMSKDLNFTYNVLEPREGETWGVLLSDGSWTGMMKMIAENKVVIAAAAFTVTPERSRDVSFTQVLEREAYGFMVNRPAELSRFLLFAAPFSYPVWIGIFVTVIIVSPILHLVHSLSYYYTFYGKEDGKGLYKLKNCFWYIYGSLLQQGGIHLPEAISGRMLIGFWWLFVIVTVTTYSGNLVAFLTFPKIESPVNTVSDLTNFRGVESWGFLAGSVIEDHLKRSSDPKFEVLYKKAVKHPAFNRTVLNLVTGHQHAYIDWKIVLLTAMRDDLRISGRCEYIIGHETFFEEKIALAVPQKSPYLPIFNKQISQMLQTGLLKKWKSRYWPTKDRCSLMTVAAGNRKVGVKDMQGSFYLLSLGFLAALIVLVVEFLVFRRKKLRLINTLKVLVANSGNSISGKASAIWQQKQFPFLH